MEKVWFTHWPEGVPKSLDYGNRPLLDYLSRVAEEVPDRIAIQYYGREISYRELFESVHAFAAGLQEQGLQKGDRVGLFLDNSPAFVIAFFGALLTGAVVVPVNPMFKSEELLYQITDAAVETLVIVDNLIPIFSAIRDQTSVKTIVIVHNGDWLPELPGLHVPPGVAGSGATTDGAVLLSEWLEEYRGHQSQLPDNSMDDPALLQYTSGTTGLPKGAMMTQLNLLANTMTGKHWLAGEDGAVHLAVLPFFHVTGMVNSMCVPLYGKGTLVLLSRFDLETVIDAIEKFRVNYWVSTATMNIALVNYPGVESRDLTSLVACTTGGAPVPLPVFEKFVAMTGSELIEGYGLSETMAQVTINPMGKGKLGSIGIPIMDVDLKIMDMALPDNELPIGEIGEIAIKGPQIMAGYWKRADETQAVFQDGYFYTGDLGYMDEEGFVFISGRKKELIKASGYSVFPAEVESHLYRHPAVAEACVYGVPHEYRGEDIKAVIVLKPEFQGKVTPQEIAEWSRNQMAAYKYPRMVEIRESLPKTGSGKILRRALVEQELGKTHA